MDAGDWLYIDTNELDQAFPALSARVQNLVQLANQMAVRVAVPEIALWELERHWNERWRERVSKVKAAMREVEIQSAGVGMHWAASLIDLEPQTAYPTTVRELFSQWNLEVISTANVSAADIVQLAINRELCFADQGKNLQDVLILMSVVEHAAIVDQTRKRTHTLISRDRVFADHRQELEAYAADQHGVIIQFCDVDAITRLLETAQSDADSSRRRLHRELAVKSLAAHKRELQAWLNGKRARFSLPMTEGLRWRHATQIAVREIKDAVLPEHTDEPGVSVAISADIKVDLLLRLGSELGSVGSGFLEMMEQTRFDANRIVTVECNGVFTGSEYAQFEFTGARLHPIPPPQPPMRTIRQRRHRRARTP